MGAAPSLPSRLSQHERLLEPLAGSAELHEPAVVHHAFDDGRRELVVGEDRAPSAELDVGGEYHAPPPHSCPRPGAGASPRPRRRARS